MHFLQKMWWHGNLTGLLRTPWQTEHRKLLSGGLAKRLRSYPPLCKGQASIRAWLEPDSSPPLHRPRERPQEALGGEVGHMRTPSGLGQHPLRGGSYEHQDLWLPIPSWSWPSERFSSHLQARNPLSILSQWENGGPALGGSLELGTNIRASGKECLALTMICFCMAAPVIIRCRGASTSWQ